MRHYVKEINYLLAILMTESLFYLYWCYFNRGIALLCVIRSVYLFKDTLDLLLRWTATRLTRALANKLFEAYNGLAEGRNGIMSKTTIDAVNTNIRKMSKELSHLLNGISTEKVNLATRMATKIILDGNFHVQALTFYRMFLKDASSIDSKTTGARNTDVAKVLRVNINQIFRLQAFLKRGCTKETDLLVRGEQELDRTMLDFIVLDGGHGQSQTNAVIGTKCSICCFQPAILYA